MDFVSLSGTRITQKAGLRHGYKLEKDGDKCNQSRVTEPGVRMGSFKLDACRAAFSLTQLLNKKPLLPKFMPAYQRQLPGVAVKMAALAVDLPGYAMRTGGVSQQVSARLHGLENSPGAVRF